MESITRKEIEAMLVLLKDYARDYNANSLSRQIGLTPMGTLKILRRLEGRRILSSKRLGKAVFYRPDYGSGYARKYLAFLLQKEAEEAPPRIRRWVNDLKRLEGHAQAGIIFGSILTKESHGDVDLLLVMEQRQNEAINSLMGELNRVNVKKIHPLKQTRADIIENLGRGDRVVANAVRTGVVAFGHENIVEAIGDVARRQ